MGVLLQSSSTPLALCADAGLTRTLWGSVAAVMPSTGFDAFQPAVNRERLSRAVSESHVQGRLLCARGAWVEGAGASSCQSLVS